MVNDSFRVCKVDSYLYAYPNMIFIFCSYGILGLLIIWSNVLNDDYKIEIEFNVVYFIGFLTYFIYRGRN